MWSGLSVLDIALTHHLDVSLVHGYLDRFLEQGLIEAAPVTPEYARSVRWVSSLEGGGK
jgi:hypothetical protein